MTNEQLAAIDYGIRMALRFPLNGPVSKEELLSWTMTYLVQKDNKVTMKTVWIPEQKKKD
jgi:hypothetical protein